ncbi:transmembrane protease serine 9 [Cephus cinctus]|uniref:Transmembrane protease serine 9 n=1 Tax=Cephus cinctus TaxID=211228 RepID=A0AAJ7CAH4_CEPCN|nr:transmembrane protease serine 9 [Cephus cinctus]
MNLLNLNFLTNFVTRLLHLFDIFSSNDLSSTCGIISEPKIEGGHSVNYYKYPWYGEIFSSNNGTDEYFCGGNLITPNHILTAAHCIADIAETAVPKNANEKITLGTYDNCNISINKFRKVFSIKSAVIHEDYDPGTLANDIGILVLNDPADNFRTVCLPKKNALLPASGTIIGFGQFGIDNKTKVCILQEATVNVYSYSECRHFKVPFNNFDLPGDICAGNPEGGVDSCSGDSGGPLLEERDNRFTIRGIVSFGIGCGDEGWPGVYTNVDYYLDWIYSKIDTCIMKSRMILSTIGILFIVNAVRSRTNFYMPRINPSCECGQSGEGVSNRIVGGVITIPHVFPWIAAIFNKGSLHCGGTLINDRYILTAGHCVKWTKHSDLSIKLGVHDIKNVNEGQLAPIDKIILHKNFESDYLHDTNDIALIKLKYSVKYNDNIRPACLPYKGSDYTGHKVKVTGWGRVTTTGGASRYLRKANLKVMPWLSCKNVSFGDHITESMICAYNENTDACQGDSGGPLLYQRYDGRYETIGIVSWGIGCAKRGMPGVYVKNSDYINWIMTNTMDAIYCMHN